MHIHYMNFHMYQKAKINSNNTSIIFILGIVLFNMIIISLRLGTYSVGTMLRYHAESPRFDPQHPIKWVWCGMCNPSTWVGEAGWSEGHPHHIVSSPAWVTREQTPKRKQCLQELEVIIKTPCYLWYSHSRRGVSRSFPYLPETGSDETLENHLVFQQNWVLPHSLPVYQRWARRQHVPFVRSNKSLRSNSALWWLFGPIPCLSLFTWKITCHQKTVTPRGCSQKQFNSLSFQHKQSRVDKRVYPSCYQCADLPSKHILY